MDAFVTLAGVVSVTNDGRDAQHAVAFARARDPPVLGTQFHKRRERLPAHCCPAGRRWARRQGRGRPLGHRRHRGRLWNPGCLSCGRSGSFTTHFMERPSIIRDDGAPSISLKVFGVARAALAISRALCSTDDSSTELQLALLLATAFDLPTADSFAPQLSPPQSQCWR